MSTEQEDTRLTPDEGSSAPGQRGSDGKPSEGEPAGDSAAGDSAAGDSALHVPDDYEELKAKAAERDRFLDELKRARADFDNLQKRTCRERPQLERKGARRVLAELLGVVDNFERALASLGAESAAGGARGVSGLEEGVRMIHQQLEELLRNQGVKEIAALGETFDPEYHEAVIQEEVEDRPTGEVVEVLQRGFLHHDAVLRPTAVKVALNVADRDRAASRSAAGDRADDGESDVTATRGSDAER